MKVRLPEWAADNFNPPPHRNTLTKWAKDGYISPAPVFIGRSYFVEKDARFVGAKTKAPDPIGSKKQNRPRMASRKNWPEYLAARTRSKGLYYTWKHPVTGKEYGLGYNFSDAAAQARDANARLSTDQEKNTLIDKQQESEKKLLEEIKNSYSLTPQSFSVLTGVYFLFCESEVVYVGKSTNIVKRVHQHYSDGKVFDRFAYIEFEERFLDYEERKYIKMYSPKYNISHNHNQTNDTKTTGFEVKNDSSNNG